MARVNWSSLVESIRESRSRRALFFKPVCVIAAIDLADESQEPNLDLDREAIVERFADYVTPFHAKRGNDGFQPLWRLTNNGLWVFSKAGRVLTQKEFPDGDPGTKARLFERFDRLQISDDFASLWLSSDQRRRLRGEMLQMLHGSDRDSQKLVRPLFDPTNLLDRDRWPLQEQVDEALAPFRAPEMFEAREVPHRLAEEDDPQTHSPIFAEAEKTLQPAVAGIPSAIEYSWSGPRIVADPTTADLPLFLFSSSKREFKVLREACVVQAEDLLEDIDRGLWQLRVDYRVQISRYLKRLPNAEGHGQILLADAAMRILRDLFAAERRALPDPFAAQLKALLQQHIALRPFYPEIEAFYRAVQTGRLEEPLPIDAVESVIEIVQAQTPMIFDESVSSAIVEASAPDPVIVVLEDEGVQAEEVILPPADPLGDLDPKKAHNLQIAGVFNRLWKVFTSGGKLFANAEAWGKAFHALNEPMKAIIDWLNRFGES